MPLEHASFDQMNHVDRRAPAATRVDRWGSAIVAAVQRQAAYTAEAALYESRTRMFHHWRRRLVELLPLRPGEVVLDVGCGTGLCFSLVQEAIGPGGTIIGIEPSPQMLAQARQRIARHGWQNVVLIEAPAERAEIPRVADHALFCAVHDVLQSPAALHNVLGRVRPGGRVAAVGGKWAPPWAIGLNTLVATTHAPFVRDFTGFDRPWARLAQHLTTLQVQEIEMGCGYLAVGRTGPRPPEARTA
jgi:demethylmenaquinone methyltransferase/2-methoxy-6-polyprenyl-1,4-benzoquinol methylase